MIVVEIATDAGVERIEFGDDLHAAIACVDEHLVRGTVVTLIET